MTQYESEEETEYPPGTPRTESDALIEAARLWGDCEELVIEDPDVGPVRVLSVSAGRQIQSVRPYLDEYRSRPERREGQARLTTLRSFIDHVNRFKDASSAIFACDLIGDPSLTAVLDYHHGGPMGAPRFGRHRAHYAFPLSQEWMAWRDLKPMRQAEFAAFLEDRIGDVLEPTSAGGAVKAFADKLGLSLAGPSTLMALARGLDLRVDAKVVQAVNLSTGEGQLTYEEAHKDGAGAPLKVPGGFAIGVPVFRGGEPFAIPVRLRYRVSSGNVTWSLQLHRADAAFRTAFDEACSRAQSETELPLFYGQPES